MDLFLDTSRSRGITRQLFEQIRDAIEGGRLTPGERLPPSRDVAAQFGISRHTVTTAYGRLAAEGYVAGHAGAGSFVTDLHRPVSGSATRAPAGLRPTGYQSGRIRPNMTNGASIIHDLRLGSPDPDLFPLVEWRRAMTTALQQRPPGYGDPAGELSLRRSIARWIAKSRFVVADPEQVVVTAGAQQAIDLVGRALLAPGDLVAVEDPGYPPARFAFEAIGARVTPIPVDENGIVVDAVPAGTRVVYTTPSHQFPLGVTMSMARRRALLELADRHDMAILEDDYDSEYRHVDRPLEPLHRLDQSGRVVYLGTFSKTLTPSLRLGFGVLPAGLVDVVAGLREAIDRQPPDVLQVALHRFITDGTFDRHLRRTRRVYSDRHRIVGGFVRRHSQMFEPVSSNAGLHVAALLRNNVGDLDVVSRARDRGVAVEALSSYRIAAAGPSGLLIGFGTVTSEALPAALDLIGEAVRECA